MRLVAIVAAAIAPTLAASACVRPVTPDVVIVNARVFTNDTARPWAEAVAIKGERVVRVGSSTEVGAEAGAATRVIDVGGRVLVPGLNDARVDLPLDSPPTPASLTTLDRAAIAQGVTSLQIIAGGPMRTLVEAARQAERQARWRLIRSPMDGERPQDEEPFLPPQPGRHLFANGVAWQLSDMFETERAVLSADRIPTVLGWAYGAEDPLLMAGSASRWIGGLASAGLADVWRRKRPRIDVLGPIATGPAELAAVGVVATWTPNAVITRAWTGPGRSPLRARPQHPGEFVDAGVVVALGSASAERTLGVVAAVSLDGRPASGRPLTREEAVRALTWGSAYAEKSERDKGWFGSGTLADLAVLSDDIFTVPTDRVAAITSVLTLVGGAIVYDPLGLVAASPR